MFSSITRIVPAVALAAVLGLAGCASNGPYGGGGYGTTATPAPSRCETCGLVQNVEQVYVQGDGHQALGTVIGALAGAALGHQVGGGSGKTAATVAGAVAGGVAGNQIGKRTGNGEQLAWRVTLRLDNGQLATVTQKEQPDVQVGDRAQIRGDHVYRM